MNVIKWENVPNSIDVRFLNLALCERGQVVFFKDEVLNELLALPVNLGGSFNVYGIPNNYVAYSPFNGYRNKNLTPNNSVLIYNNYLRQPSENIINIYANKLYNIDRTIDINVNSQRTPIIMSGTKNQQLTLSNMVDQYEGNEPFIFTDSSLDIDRFKIWNTQAPFVGDKLESLKHNILNDFLSNFGVENANADKKERMVSDEVNANYGLVEANRTILLAPKEEAIKKINDMFGIDIKVSFNSDLMTMINANNFNSDTITSYESVGGNIE